MQRIGNSLRRGCVRNIGLERFVGALEDTKTGLTYPALTGVRKQSVEDVERLFGQGVIDFMEENNYENEAEYLRKVRNWRKARLKGRETPAIYYRILRLHNQRSHALVYKDFSLLEVNR